MSCKAPFSFRRIFNVNHVTVNLHFSRVEPWLDPISTSPPKKYIYIYGKCLGFAPNRNDDRQRIIIIMIIIIIIVDLPNSM